LEIPFHKCQVTFLVVKTVKCKHGINVANLQESMKALLWTSASGGHGPLDFHTWYRYSTYERLNSAIFRFFLLFFGLFSVGPAPWKRLNSAIFRSFLLFSVFFPLVPLEIFLPTPLRFTTKIS